jgi:hypothetical protein
VTLDELDEAAAFSGGDLDVGDFAEALEEGAQLIFRNVPRKSSDKNGGIVRIGKLIHGLLLLLLAVEGHWRTSHGGWVHRAASARHSHSTRTTRAALVLWCCRRNTHGSVSTVYTLHFAESSLLINFIGEADKAIATRHAGDGVSHNFGGFAWWEAALKEGNEDEFVDFWAEITNKDGIFGPAVITAERVVSGYRF